MEIKLENLVPYVKVATDIDSVFELVEKNGMIVILKDNLPAYILHKYDAKTAYFTERAMQTSKVYTPGSYENRSL